MFGLAQAAAVLLVVGLVRQTSRLSQDTQVANRPTPAQSNVSSASVDSASFAVEIEEGSLVVIRSESDEPKVLVFTTGSSPFGFDDWLVMLNFAESMAPNSIVAMKE
jgi:hypothetical protein